MICQSLATRDRLSSTAWQRGDIVSGRRDPGTRTVNAAAAASHAHVPEDAVSRKRSQILTSVAFERQRPAPAAIQDPRSSSAVCRVWPSKSTQSQQQSSNFCRPPAGFALRWTSFAVGELAWRAILSFPEGRAMVGGPDGAQLEPDQPLAEASRSTSVNRVIQALRWNRGYHRRSAERGTCCRVTKFQWFFARSTIASEGFSKQITPSNQVHRRSSNSDPGRSLCAAATKCDVVLGERR
jgi:hypothetical protein